MWIVTGDVVDEKYRGFFSRWIVPATLG